MKLRFVLTFLAVPALVSAAPVAATMPGSAVQSADNPTKEASADSDKLICKRDKVSGSRLSARKVCMTAAEWERQRIEDRQAVEKIQTNRTKSN